MPMNSKASDLSDQLNKLAKLHADGSLSDDEFKALKAKLISTIGGNAGNENVPDAVNKTTGKASTSPREQPKKAHSKLDTAGKIAFIIVVAALIALFYGLIGNWMSGEG